MSAGFAIAAPAPEGIPEGIKIMHRSGTPGIQQIRGNNIRLGRIHLGMSQEAFGKKVCVDPKYLKKIEEGGAIPRAETLQRIAKGLDCEVDELDRRHES